MANNEVEVSLIRQDSSDCVNSTVPNDPDLRVGSVIVVRNDDGTTTVVVDATLTPDTAYNFYLKCVRQIGSFTTGDEGTGGGKFSFNTDETGATFAFDCYGDPQVPGDIYQACTVNF